MKTLSTFALLMAVSMSVPAVAAGVAVNSNGGVSANSGGTSVNANGGATTNLNNGAVNANGGGGASASTNEGGVSGSADANSSTSASAGQNQNSSSSAADSSASVLSSAVSSSSSGDCSGVDKSALGTGPIDNTALSGVTSVSVVAVSDCSGLSLDQGSAAALGTNTKVSDAIKAAGYAGQDILGYAMDAASLTVYVKKS